MLENLVVFYFLIGIIYCIVNGWLRGLDTEGDYLLPMGWIGLWPLFIIALVIDKTYKLFKKNDIT